MIGEFAPHRIARNQTGVTFGVTQNLRTRLGAKNGRVASECGSAPGHHPHTSTVFHCRLLILLWRSAPSRLDVPQTSNDVHKLAFLTAERRLAGVASARAPLSWLTRDSCWDTEVRLPRAESGRRCARPYRHRADAALSTPPPRAHGAVPSGAAASGDLAGGAARGRSGCRTHRGLDRARCASI